MHVLVIYRDMMLIFKLEKLFKLLFIPRKMFNECALYITNRNKLYLIRCEKFRLVYSVNQDST